ncbi:MAG: polysaccharide deacetylase family protein [Bacillota bacterium]|jgi:biofilm PGA synthesis lipoprotein PgaB
MKRIVVCLIISLLVILTLCSCTVVIGEDKYKDVESGDAAGIAILVYHHLEPAAEYEARNKYNGSIMPVEGFSKQMKYLSENGYHTLFVSELVDLLQKGEDLPHKTVVITFDDGYESNYQYAFPIMQKYGLKGTVNIVVWASIKADGATYNEKNTFISHLNSAQMKKMVKEGVFEFQSHTYDSHKKIIVNAQGDRMPMTINKRYLTTENRQETCAEYHQRLVKDLTKSKEYLEKNLGTKTIVLCYPYGKANTALIDAAKESGIVAGLSLSDGLVTKKSDLYELPRIAILPTDDLDDFAYKIEYATALE